MFYMTGVATCNYTHGCGRTAAVRFPLNPDGFGVPEPLPDGNGTNWLLPTLENPDAGATYCPEHRKEYTPPHKKTRAEARAELEKMGMPPAVIDGIIRRMPED